MCVCLISFLTIYDFFLFNHTNYIKACIKKDPSTFHKLVNIFISKNKDNLKCQMSYCLMFTQY